MLSCIFVGWDRYISLLPSAAFEKVIFYCRPMDVYNDSGPWFMAAPIGKNLLAKMVPTMCEEANIVGKKTNHSLRVAGASSLFAAGIPERVIQQRIGHRSLDGLRTYERVTEDQGFPRFCQARILVILVKLLPNQLICLQNNPNLHQLIHLVSNTIIAQLTYILLLLIPFLAGLHCHHYHIQLFLMIQVTPMLNLTLNLLLKIC